MDRTNLTLSTRTSLSGGESRTRPGRESQVQATMSVFLIKESSGSLETTEKVVDTASTDVMEVDGGRFQDLP